MSFTENIIFSQFICVNQFIPLLIFVDKEMA